MSTATRNRPRAPRTPNNASAPQLRYITDLVNGRVMSDDLATVTTFLVEVTQRHTEGKVREDDPAPLSSVQASKLIEQFLQMDRKPQAGKVESPGVFEMDGELFVVVYSKSDRLYARQYIQSDGETKIDKWTKPRTVAPQYAKGVMGRLRESHRVSDARQRELGRFIARCVDCGRRLSKSESVERGKGDICASKS